MLLILGVATVVKLFLYFYCQALSAKSSIMLALAEDHRNDVMSNSKLWSLSSVPACCRIWGCSGWWKQAWHPLMDCACNSCSGVPEMAASLLSLGVSLSAPPLHAPFCCSAVVAMVGAAVAANFKKLWWFDPVSWPAPVLLCQALSQRRVTHLNPVVWLSCRLQPCCVMCLLLRCACLPLSAGPCHHNLHIHYIFLGQDLQGPGGSLGCNVWLLQTGRCVTTSWPFGSAMSASHVPCCLTPWQCPTPSSVDQAPGLGCHSQQIGGHSHVHSGQLPIQPAYAVQHRTRPSLCRTSAEQTAQSSIASHMASNCTWPPCPWLSRICLSTSRWTRYWERGPHLNSLRRSGSSVSDTTVTWRLTSLGEAAQCRLETCCPGATGTAWMPAACTVLSLAARLVDLDAACIEAL